MIEVSAAGKARAVISDEPKTFFSYRNANGSVADSGRRYRFDVSDGKEIIWMSERDGWSHLYLYDGVTGAVKNQITRGEFVVRAVQRVDETKRQIWFSATPPTAITKDTTSSSDTSSALTPRLGIKRLPPAQPPETDNLGTYCRGGPPWPPVA